MSSRVKNKELNLLLLDTAAKLLTTIPQYFWVGAPALLLALFQKPALDSKDEWILLKDIQETWADVEIR